MKKLIACTLLALTISSLIPATTFSNHVAAKQAMLLGLGALLAHTIAYRVYFGKETPSTWKFREIHSPYEGLAEYNKAREQATKAQRAREKLEQTDRNTLRTKGLPKKFKALAGLYAFIWTIGIGMMSGLIKSNAHSGPNLRVG